MPRTSWKPDPTFLLRRRRLAAAATTGDGRPRSCSPRRRPSARADALLFGRVTYQMMEAAGGPVAGRASWPAWMEPCAADDAAKKTVSRTLARRLERRLVRGDLGEAVRRLKEEPGTGSSWAACSSRGPWPSWA